jgi:rRNA biogenesis protein RRP5
MDAFPRGGKVDTTKSASKMRRSLNFSHNDDIFGTQRANRIEVAKPSGGSKKKRSLPNLLAAVSHKDLAVDQVHAVERIKKATYVEGALAMGYILQIHESNATVSLPGGLTGTVEYANISDLTMTTAAAASGKRKSGSLEASGPIPIGDLLSVHQPVRCIVLGSVERTNSRKTTISLSLRGSLVNRGLALKHLLPGFPVYGCVASKEDHGYIIATGISGVTFFLPSKAIPVSKEVKLGQPIECLIESINEAARTALVSARPAQTAAAITVGSKLTHNAIVPGMLVNAVVDKVLKV